jgi:hypothetical protein
METVTEAMARLRERGFRHDFSAVAGGRLRCGECGAVIDPADVRIEEIVRFEGVSDPGDESILFALSCGCGHDGLYSAPYGPDATPEDVAVVALLHR